MSDLTSKRSTNDKVSANSARRSGGQAQRPVVFGAFSDFMSLQSTAGNQAVGQLLRPEDGDSLTDDSGLPQAVGDVLQSGGGQPLDTAVRKNMEAHFGEDFSQVMVYTDAAAVESARGLQAKAYTSGTQLVFNAGQYSPATPSGEQVLAHELAHVVQYRNAGVKPQPGVGSYSGTAEVSAEVAAKPVSGSSSSRKSARPGQRSGSNPGSHASVALKNGNNGAPAAAQRSPEQPSQPKIRKKRHTLVGLPSNIKNEIIKTVADIRNLWETHNVSMVERIRVVATWIRNYSDRGEDAAHGGVVLPSIYVDAFVFLLSTTTCDRGVIVSNAKNLWDDTLESASNEQRSEILAVLSDVGSTYGTYMPPSDHDRPSFERDVFLPVMYKAFEQLSIGIADKDMFDTAAKAADGTWYGAAKSGSALFYFIGEKILNIMSFGVYRPTTEAVEKYLRENPDDTFWEGLGMSFIIGRRAAFKSLGDTLLGVHDMDVIFGYMTGVEVTDPQSSSQKVPTIWEAVEALGSFIIKVVSLHDMAHTEVHSVRKRIKAEPDIAEQGKKVDLEGVIPDMDFKKILDSFKPGEEISWATYITKIGADSPQAKALEAGRRVLAQELFDKFGVRRTGSDWTISDLDMNADGARAERNIEAAKKYLAEKYGLPEELVLKMLDLSFLSDARRAYMYDDPRLPARARVRIREKVTSHSQMRYLERMKALGKTSHKAEADFKQQAKNWGIDEKGVREITAMSDVEARSLRLKQDDLHIEFEDLAAKRDALSTKDAKARAAIETKMEDIAAEITNNQNEINLRLQEYWETSGAAYHESGALKFRVPPKTGRPSVNAHEAYGDLLNQRLEIFRKIEHVEHVQNLESLKKNRTLLTGDEMAVEIAKTPGFSKYVARFFSLADKYYLQSHITMPETVIKIKFAAKKVIKENTNLRVEIIENDLIKIDRLKRDAKRIVDAKSDPARLEKIFEEMGTERLKNFVDDVLSIHEELLEDMELVLKKNKPDMIPFAPKNEQKKEPVRP